MKAQSLNESQETRRNLECGDSSPLLAAGFIPPHPSPNNERNRSERQRPRRLAGGGTIYRPAQSGTEVPHSKAALALTAIFATVCLLAGCGKSGAQSTDNAAPSGASPQRSLEVGVVTLTAREVTLTQELPARVFAFREAEVRARVDGIIQKRCFEEGTLVKEGELLYQIDDASYQAAVNSAKATLAKARSNLESARLKEQRYKTLLDNRVASQQDYEDVLASLLAGEADVLSAEAQLETARIDLGYTRVTTPVSGYIGKSEVTEGAYVRKNDATLLATVRQTDKVYVDMTQSSTDMLRVKQALQRNDLRQADSADSARVTLTLEDGSAYAHEGSWKFTDASASSATSSVTVRAVFPNPDGFLLPGMFVRARIVEAKKTGAILAPQSAVMRNTKGEPYAYVARDDGVAEQRALTVSRSIDNQWLVESGLRAGDRLIVDNLQRLADGARVSAVSTGSAGFQPASSALGATQTAKPAGKMPTLPAADASSANGATLALAQNQNR